MTNFLTDQFLALGIDPALGGVTLGAVLGWLACSLRPKVTDSSKAPFHQTLERPASTEHLPSTSATTSTSTSHRVSIDVDGQEKVLEGEQVEEFFQALRSGQKITAIRILREATGLGLKESKDLVEAMDSSKL